MPKIYVHLPIKEEYTIKKACFINTINVIKGYSLNNCFINVGGCNDYSIINMIIKLYNLSDYKNIRFIKDDNKDNLYQIIKNKNILVVYSRDNNFPIYLCEKKYDGKIYMEAHSDYPPKKVLPYKKRITHITISSITKKRWGFKKSIVFPCSVDTHFFSTKPENIIKYNYQFNVVYGGHIYPYKGIPILIELGKIIKNIGIHIIGGDKEQIKEYKNVPENVIFYGQKNQSELKKYLYGGNLLILPYTNNHFQSTTTSPIKLFEYMSTGKPILSSNIEGIKKVAKDKVYYYKADNLDDLIKNVQEIMEDKKQQIIGQKEYAEQFSCKEKCKLML